MQGKTSFFNSFHETIDLNQGSDSHTTSMDRSAGWDDLLNPVESHLSNYAPSSGEGNVNFMNPVAHNAQPLSGFDPGESSSSINSLNQLNGEELKMGHGWSSSLSDCVMTDTRSTHWRVEQPDIFLPEGSSRGYGGNYSHRPPSIRNSSSARNPLNLNVTGGYPDSTRDSWQGRGPSVSPNFSKPVGSGTQHWPTFGGSSDHIGTSCGSSDYFVQTGDGSGSSSSTWGLSYKHGDGSSSSSSTWGLSCKRKALEGCSGQSCPSGNLGTNPQHENVGRHTVPAHYNASSKLIVSAPSDIMPSSSHVGQVNPRIGFGTRGVASDAFLPLRATEVTESSQRNFGFRENLGQQDPVSFDSSASGTDMRHYSVGRADQALRLMSTTETANLRPPVSRSIPSNNPPNQYHAVQVPGSGRSLPFPWNGSLSARAGSSSGSLFFGERDALRDDASFRNSSSNREHTGFVSASETRPLVQEPPNLSFAPGNTSSSRNAPPSSRIEPTSGSRSFSTVWRPHQNPTAENLSELTAHNQQRLPELPPWTLFPPTEPEPGNQRGYFSMSPSGPSSSEEAVMSSGSSNGVFNRPFSRAFLMEASNDDMTGWRALAAGIEGRQRLVSEIRQVLNAMRMAENLQAEDYMLFDPSVSGVAELHDRHRDMRLDVDNMSYEELLALEERIGNVSMGLSEEAIFRSMKQRKCQYVMIDSSMNEEPCCICQENYSPGDYIGTLDCGHEFHSDCIKQWLALKNICPICKMTALES